MSNNMVDVTVHIDEDTSHDERESLRDKVLAQNGVMAAFFNKDKPHLMMVEYDPAAVSSKEILTIVKGAGVHAKLVGM
jgi:hypothetical protein